MSTKSPLPFDFRVGLLLRQAHRRAAASFEQALAPLAIDGRDFGVLLLLASHGVATQKQLIDRLGSDKASMVRTIDRLEARGYLTRVRSLVDRRVQDVTLTDAGRDAYGRARERAQRVTDDIFGEFNDEERQLFLSMLTRIVKGKPDAERLLEPGSMQQAN